MDVDDEPLIGASTVRGVLMLGGVATVAYIAFRYWQKVKAEQTNKPAHTIQIPVELPIKRAAVKK